MGAARSGWPVAIKSGASNGRATKMPTTLLASQSQCRRPTSNAALIASQSSLSREHRATDSLGRRRPIEDWAADDLDHWDPVLELVVEDGVTLDVDLGP